MTKYQKKFFGAYYEAQKVVISLDANKPEKPSYEWLVHYSESRGYMDGLYYSCQVVGLSVDKIREETAKCNLNFKD